MLQLSFAPHAIDDPHTDRPLAGLPFTIITLPPGDFATSYVQNMAAQGDTQSQETARAIREEFGLDQPVAIRYLKWMQGILTRGDFGIVFEMRQPVSSVIWERGLAHDRPLVGQRIHYWAIAFPIGIYSAVKQYSLGDYVFTFLGFVGIAVPSFWSLWCLCTFNSSTWARPRADCSPPNS